MESVKICHFKIFRPEHFALRTFRCIFLHYIRVKKFVKRFQQNMSLSQRNLRGLSIELKNEQFRLKWKHDGIQNITDAPTLTSIYIDLYIRDGICQNLSF